MRALRLFALPSTMVSLGFAVSCAAAPRPAAQPALASATPAPLAEPPVDWLVPSPLLTLVPGTPAPEPPPTPLEALARHVADDWVRERACGGPAESAATDCEAAVVRVRDERTDGGLGSAVIEVEGQGDAWTRAAFVALQNERGPHAVFPLGEAWSSGVGGTSHTVAIEHVEVHDVFGDAAPEWWAEVEIATHDSDTGLCRETGTIARALVMCTSSGARVACGRVPLVSMQYEDTSALDPSCDPARRTGNGFAQAARVTRDGVALTPSKQALGQHVITGPRPAPFTGTVTMSTLLARAPVDDLCGSAKLTCSP